MFFVLGLLYRFPYLDANKFNENGAKEHFLALFPCDIDEQATKRPSYLSSLFLRSGSVKSTITPSEDIDDTHLLPKLTSDPPFSEYCQLEKCPEFSEDIAFFKKKQKYYPFRSSPLERDNGNSSGSILKSNHSNSHSNSHSLRMVPSQVMNSFHSLLQVSISSFHRLFPH